MPWALSGERSRSSMSGQAWSSVMAAARVMAPDSWSKPGEDDAWGYAAPWPKRLGRAGGLARDHDEASIIPFLCALITSRGVRFCAMPAA
jgi:hypothetical protein